MKKILRAVISIGLLIGSITFVLDRTDWPTVFATFARLSWLAVMLAVIAMLVGALLASRRLQWIAADLGYRLSFADAVSALSFGQLFGHLFFQLAGQLMARSAVLSRRQIPVSGTIVITGYERLAALAVSLALALVAAIYLFGSVSLDFINGGSVFLKLVMGLIAVTGSGAAMAWGRLVAAKLPPLTGRVVLRVASNFALSLVIQLTTVLAYAVVARTIAPNVSLASLIAASALVMLAASLPISLGGWGIREMSAIFALGAVGVSAEASLTVAVTIGVVSLLAVGLLALATIRHHLRPPTEAAPAARQPFDYAAMLDYVLPLFVATAVFFQIIAPIGNNFINVNFGDPAAILCGSLFVLNHFGRHWPAWRLPKFALHVALATAVMIAAYLHGLIGIGWIDWAFANRFLGWFVLLCYGATGALIVVRGHYAGFNLLLRTFVATGVAITALDLVLAVFVVGSFPYANLLGTVPLVGFSQNRNAFAFILLLVLCVLTVTRWRDQTALIGITFAGLALTGSRAIFIATAAVMGIAAFIHVPGWRKIGTGLLIGAAIVLFVVFAPNLLTFGYLGGTTHRSARLLTEMLTMSPTSDAEHIKSVIGGWHLFLRHPIFGAGLGAFVDSQLREGTMLIIHSTPLWLLAETGLVGFAIMVVPLARIFFAELYRGQNNDIASKLLILVITAFSVASNAHDMMYQRGFWLLFGACLAFVPAIGPAGREHVLSVSSDVTSRV